MDQAIQLNPRLEDAHDLKAYSLVRREGYDEARQACAASVWNGQPPLILRGGAAWIEAERGETEEAIRPTKATVADSPDYYWGWENLADWSRREDANDDYLQASENLVGLAPNDAIPYGYRGDARRRKGDRAGGKADFRHAQELDPTYRYGGQQLFDMQLADGELDDAVRTLSVLKEHAADEFSVLTRGATGGGARPARRSDCELQAPCVTKMEAGGRWRPPSPPSTRPVGRMMPMRSPRVAGPARRPCARRLAVDRSPCRTQGLALRPAFRVAAPTRGVRPFAGDSLRQGAGQGEGFRSLARVHSPSLSPVPYSTSDWANVGYCFATLEDYRNGGDGALLVGGPRCPAVDVHQPCHRPARASATMPRPTASAAVRWS